MTKTGGILSVYLPGDLKPRWALHCKRQDETPSSGIRQVGRSSAATPSSPKASATPAGAGVP